ncbi:undecaprenyl-diphosphate phosphatase [Kordiimonas sp. SCSIO 12610]|uniref:undecaprenyl-diphosphate phosphatase n=1 Tax=Kordiimonas sp. SCSIO 12610 TaxID=2829597 RepID=UPI00210EE41F|nr:undecaprenyl-diphosphate phosphatase [Kordiimonas sp. SCSIO 12610]UTW55415.1 undecaprenyl-diphosphate phosphatase [Kordiimonas sp. SCSIO 12610]
MSVFQLIILALIQGITEFLPISSSGHLALVPALTGWQDQGNLIDVAAHIGTLAAVLLYFRTDTKGLTLAAIGAAGVTPARRAIDGTLYSKLFWYLVIATIPTVIVGLAFKATGLDDAIRLPHVIAASSIVFGILLYVADKRGAVQKSIDNMAIKPALLIGLAQVLALIPGTSRAGITMTAGRWLGFNRIDAARFSMLLSIPTIFAAGVLGIKDIIESGNAVIWQDAAIVAGLSCVTAMAAIHILMKWLEHATMTIFVIYRVLLGILLFALIGTGLV